MQNDELIARLEAATGADRELDAAIHEVLTGKCPHIHIMVVAGDGDGWGEVCSRCCEEEPEQVFRAYTASIDAALTLADSESDPLDLLEDALQACRNERDGVLYLPLHICIAAVNRLRARNEGEG